MFYKLISPIFQKSKSVKNILIVKCFKKRISNLKLIGYDFDGIHTDNRVILDENGVESVIVNRSDGLAVNRIKQIGIHQVIITTEANQVVRKRGQKLGIPVLDGVGNKKDQLVAYCDEKKIDLQNVAFVGNDINDLEVMLTVGLSICSADAADEIKKISNIVLFSNGGKGCIREILSMVLMKA